MSATLGNLLKWLLFHGRRYLLPFLALNALELLLFVVHHPQTKLYRCYMQEDTNDWNDWIYASGPRRLKNILDMQDQPVAGRNIFFHETKCRSPDSQYIVNLTTRQACAIESAALHNPNYQVFVLFASVTHLPGISDPINPITEAVLSYKNVDFRQLNVRRYVENTPIEKWFYKGDLFHSRYLTEHTSDMLRILSVYRFGGIYLDLDMIVLRSLEDVHPNYVGAETETSICNGVISLEPNGFGHEVGRRFLRDFQDNFNGHLWAHNGPRCLGRVMSKICGTKKVRLMLDNPQRCQGFRVYNMSAFYEINWGEWWSFFEPKLQRETLERVQKSYVIHLWNHLNTYLSFDPESAYTQLAAKNCPKVFAAVAGRFL